MLLNYVGIRMKCFMVRSWVVNKKIIRWDKNKKRENKVFMFISLLAFMLHIIHIFWLWSDIPHRIAIHFTNGEAEHWGSIGFFIR